MSIPFAMDSNTGEIVSGPDVVSRGFVYVRESENLMDDLKRTIRERVRKLEENHVSDWSTINQRIPRKNAGNKKKRN